MVSWGSGIDADFWLSVSRGKVHRHTTVVIRGHNSSQSAASGFVEVAEMGDLDYLTSAETMEIVSTSGDDSAAGVGLQTLFLSGVDGSFSPISEVVTMNGTNDVTTANSYLRVNTMVGLDVGATGWNAGNITATATTAATIQDELDAGEGISQSSHYTVPSGYTLFVLKAELNVARVSGGQDPVVEFQAQARTGAGDCWLQLFDKRFAADVTDELDVTPHFPAPLVAGSDVRFRADVSVNNTETRTRMYGLLVEDGAP